MSGPLDFIDGDTYLNGNYAPILDERVFDDLTVVEGAIPERLEGVFARNGSNPRFAPKSPYHWFDGDGMMHTITFGGGRATYRNRFIQTPGLAEDETAGCATWGGLLERPDFKRAGGPYKNTGNTDVVFWNKELLALWWLGGKTPFRLGLPELETRGAFEAAGSFTAHAKVDPRTNNLIFLDYGPVPPFLTHGVLTPEGQLTRTPIELPGPRPQHDVAITERFSVLLDVSLFADPVALKAGKMRMRFFGDTPTRVGLFDRTTQTMRRWFEVDPCYVYHFVNAWEDGNTVVVTTCRVTDPLMYDPQPGRSDRKVPHIGHLRLAPELVQWTLDLETGAVTQKTLDDTLAEFPAIDRRRLGQPHHHTWLGTIAEDHAFRFNGVRRSSLIDGTGVTRHYPAGWYGGEVVFAPLGDAETDGVLITFVVEEATGTSEVWLMAPDDLKTIARLSVPDRVPTGYHGVWAPAAELRGDV